jgi:hypothetical protein
LKSIPKPAENTATITVVAADRAILDVLVPS